MIWRWKIVAASVVFWVGSVAAQSLGDVARQERAQKKPAATSRHVITEDKIPARPQNKALGASGQQADSKSKPKADDAAQDQDRDDHHPHSANEIQASIKQQKNTMLTLMARIDTLQRRLDAWKTSDCTQVRYIDAPNQNPCDEPPKIRAALGVARSQLEKEQATLEAMQEEARRLGYGNSVYDPD
jgi:hypothetical protein